MKEWLRKRGVLWLKSQLVMQLTTFDSKEVWNDQWNNPRTLFSRGYFLAWFKGM